MQYYTLTHAVDTEETGHVFPQVEFDNPKKLNPNPVLLANMSIKGAYPPDDILPFDYLELNKGAKLTDLMSSPFMNGFLISEKLKTIFEESNIKDYKIYDVTLFNKKEEVKGYYYFHSASYLKDYIDYKKSKFFIGTMLKEHIRDLNIEFTNFEQINTLHKSLPIGKELLYTKYFYLNSNFPYNLDFFQLNVFNYSFFITHRFKEKIEQNNITGVHIQSANDLIKTPNLA